MTYMAVSFAVITFAYIKVTVLFNVDNAVFLPLGMLVNDIFSAVIAIAIIKHQLFDITFIIKKGTIYSILAGVVIFVFSFTEHVLITYMGERISGHSQMIHFISIAVGIRYSHGRGDTLGLLVPPQYNPPAVTNCGNPQVPDGCLRVATKVNEIGINLGAKVAF